MSGEVGGRVCPECGTVTGVGGGPGCFCAGRVARAHRAGRSQEIAAAEVFDERRVRPYVSLPTGNDETRAPFVTAGPLPPLAAPVPYGTPRPAAPPRATPAPHRRRPLKAVALGAAAVAVLGTAAFAGGLFSGDDSDPTHVDESLAGSRPTASAPDAPPSERPSATPPRSASPDATDGAASAPTASASEPPEASAPPKAVPSKRPSATSTPTDRPADAAPSTSTPPPALAGGSLRLGDSGPEVAELQQRLAGILLYQGAPDGQFDQRVQVAVAAYQIYRKIGGDPRGVYGPDTRRALEAEGTGNGPGQGDGPGRDHQGPGRRH
ncbi:peptidoglycan-binding protein [Streptomyces sp. NPDC006638]|uniref:peptidoglycan-binding domain-containing protein n=1 Tax=Streptomyces sp. NPDC006638 TaxID=3157183 RepID=UPI0033A88594